MMALLDNDYRSIMQNNHRKISELTDLDQLGPILRTKGLLTDTEFWMLREMPSYEIRNKSKLAQILLTKGGESAFKLFIEALQEESEHLGHKNLAVALLEEKSRMKPSRGPPPPTPPRTAKSKAPRAPFTPQPAKKQPLVPPKTRSKSVAEVADKEQVSSDGLRPKVVLDVVEHDNQPTVTNMESIYVSNQLKWMNERLENNFATQQATMQTVQLLAKTVVEMQEQLNGIKQLLTSLVDNQEADTSGYNTHQGYNNSKAKLPCKNNDYTEDLSTAVDGLNNSPSHQSRVFPATVKHSRGVAINQNLEQTSSYEYIELPKAAASVASAPSQYTSLTKKDEAHCYANPVSADTFKQEHYVDVKLLAQGHSGEYWLAVNKYDRSKAVVKKPTAAISAEMLSQEINALVKCRHPNVIHLIIADMNLVEPLLYFEHAGNGKLNEFLRAEKSSTGIGIAKLLAMAASVACGMIELEKMKVIHCDLKAGSILIDGDNMCKIASFNKALCLKDDEKSRVVDPLPYRLAIRWQPPEVLSSKRFSAKSDVWSFGVLLAEIFSYGGTPYPNMETTGVKKFVLSKKKMSSPSNCPKEVYDIMKECCFHYREEARFPFTAVHKALKQLHSKYFKKDSDASASELEDDYS